MRYSIPNTNAIVIERLRLEGAIIIAKSNLAELAGGNTNSEIGGECLNPWDLRRSSGPSSTGIGAGISSGLAVICIATDTDGSIMNPSSFCGINGLRPPFGELEFDGIFPTYKNFDTVGPLANYIDDLVLAYSIMGNKIEIYDEYQTIDVKKIKVGSVKALWSNFNISYPIGEFTYIFDDQVYQIVSNAKKNFEKLNLPIVDIEMNQTEFDTLNDLSFQIIISGLSGCMDACVKGPIEKYLNDSKRFQYDSPYKSYEDLLSSPLLSKHWFETFNRSNFQNPNERCRDECLPQDSYRSKFREYVNDWFNRSNTNVLIFPTSLDLPFFIGAELDNSSPTFICPYTGLASLSISVGFSKPDQYAPDGLPVGLMMITHKDDLPLAFKMAKLYEENFSYNKKLPRVTPKIDKSNNLICNGSSKHNATFFIDSMCLIYYSV